VAGASLVCVYVCICVCDPAARLTPQQVRLVDVRVLTACVCVEHCVAGASLVCVCVHVCV